MAPTSSVPPPALRLTTLKRALLLFWALYFTVVFASNLTDALKALDVLPDGFAFVSGNYALVAQVTSIYGFPGVLNALLFAGVIAWEAAAAWLFFRAFRRFRFVEPAALAAVYAAFTASLGLWMAFILSDELFIAYEVAGLEATHVRLFAAELVSLLVLRLLPEA